MKKGVILVFVFCCSATFIFAQNPRLADLQDALGLSTKRSFGEVLKQMQPYLDSLDLLTAEGELNKTIEVAHTLQHRHLALPKIYDMLAQICVKHNQPDLALEHYLKSTEIYEKEGFKRALAHTHYRVAFLHLGAKHYSKADLYLRKALKTAKDSLETRQVINAYNAIALCYKEVKNYPLTVRYFDEALDVAKQAQDSIWIGVIYSNIGTVQYEQAEYSQALTYFLNGLRMNLAYGGEPENITSMQIAIGNTYLKMNNMVMAEKYFQDALRLANKQNISATLAQAYLGMGYVNAKGKNFEKAYAFQDLYKKVNDSINIKAKNVAILEKQHDFEIERKDLEIQLLATEADTHYFQRLGLVSGTVFLLFLTFFFIRNYRKEYKSNRLLQEKNQEIQQQKEEIESQAEQLANLNLTKDKLFSIVSHDLRSPLHSLRSALDLLEIQKLSPSDFQRISLDLRKSVDTVHGTLENLLQWAYSQMKGISIQKQMIDLKEISDEIVLLYHTISKEKEVQLSNLVVDKSLVYADKNQIRLVIRNLVSNALKFTQIGGKITLASENRGGKVIFSVADTGVGMSEAEVEKLFKTETHFTKRGTANEKGTGLGLMLCKEFVENQGGEIWVKSKQGIGSIFYFSI
jgi:two-component system, sensor histidine kinase and response regulator